MSNVDTRTAVIKAIKDTLALDDDYLVLDDQLICEVLGADSLDIRVIGLDIEYMCRIDIPDNALYGVKTVGQLIDLAEGVAAMSNPDYPLTWPQALRAAKDGAVIECSACNPEYGNITAIYDPVNHVLVDWIWTDWVLTPDAADIAAPWRIIPQEEVQP